MDITARGKTVLDLEIAALRRLKKRIDGAFEQAVQQLLKTINQRGKILVCGVGKSGHIGDKIAATLTSTGAPAVVLNALNATHGDLGLVNRGDAAIVLSYSGETDEILRIIPVLKREGVFLIAMTGDTKSTLASQSDIHLDVSVEREACPLNLAPTASTTAMLVMGDALAMALLEQRGLTKGDFARFHPGGSIGRTLLLGVRDVMRPIDSVAVCRDTIKVKDALALITAKRCGAAIVIKASGVLAGIYTHGDFARGYGQDNAIGDRPIGKVMTARPVTVRVDKLAADVLNILSQHRIEDLVVVDSKNKPVGLVDTQDLTKVKLI